MTRSMTRPMNAVPRRLHALAGRWHAAAQRLRAGSARWRALPARDRLAVGIAVLVMVLALLWLLAAQPALERRARWQRELPLLQAQSAELERLLADVPSARPLDAPRRGGTADADGLREPLAVGLDRAGLRGLYRIDAVVADAPGAAGKPAPAKAWRIEFDAPVPPGRVLSWLAEVAARGDLEVGAAMLERVAPVASGNGGDGGAQGSVRGRVDLRSTQLIKDGQ